MTNENKNPLIDKLVWGGMYQCITEDGLRTHVCKDNPYDQRYEYWVPAYCADTDEIYMVNTYQIDCSRYYKDIVHQYAEVFKKDGSGAIYATHNYYYRAAALVNEEIFDRHFQLAFDLHDYRPALRGDEEIFAEKDQLQYVRLYRGHAFPYGITLIRKDAKPNGDLVVEKEIRDIMRNISEPASASDLAWELFNGTLSKLEMGGYSYNESRVRALREYNALIEEIEEEYGDRLKELRYRINC